MKFISSKYLTIALGAILAAFFAYDIWQFPTVVLYWVVAILFMIFFVYVPGKVVIGEKVKDKGLNVLTSLGVGITVNVALFALAQYLENIWVLIVAIGVMNIYWWIFKREKFPNFFKNNLGTINSVLFILVITSPTIIFNLPVDNIGDIKALDGINNMFWQMSRTEMFKASFPSGDWTVYELKDLPFKYHYLFHLWMAEMSKITGIGVEFFYFRFFAYFNNAVIFLSALKCAQLITGNKVKAMAGAYMGTLGAGATFALAPASMIRYGGIEYIFAVGYPTYMAWFVLSPTITFSILFLFILLSLVHVWHTEKGKFPYLAYFLIFLGVLAAKGSSGLIFVAALGIYSLIFFDKKFITRIVVPNTILFIVGYALLYMGFAGEEVAESEKLGIYWFKDVTWISDSITGWKMWVLLGGFLGGAIGLRIFSLFDKNKKPIVKLIKIGYIIGTLLFIASPIKFANVFWQLPFITAAGILVAEFIMDLKKGWIKKTLMTIMILEISFGAIHVLNVGCNGYIENGLKKFDAYFEPNEYEAYVYIEENTPEDSVVWSMLRGESRLYYFDCVSICKRQNLAEGWGWSRNIGSWKYFTEEEKERHFIQEILDDEAAILALEDPDEITEILSKYEHVDYLIYPLEEAENVDVVADVEVLEEVFENEKFIVYENIY